MLATVEVAVSVPIPNCRNIAITLITSKGVGIGCFHHYPITVYGLMTWWRPSLLVKVSEVSPPSALNTR